MTNGLRRAGALPGGMINLRGAGHRNRVLRELAPGSGLAWLRANGDGWAEVERANGTTGWVAIDELPASGSMK